MAPTLDNINTIEQFADKLEKWAENLSCNTSPTKNSWVELTLLFYPQDPEVIVSRLATIPTMDQKVQKNFRKLSQIVHKLDAWRAQKVYDEELVRFGTLTDRLRHLALDIVLAVRNVSESGTSQPAPTETGTVERPNAFEMRQMAPTGTGPDATPPKLPRKEALIAYRLHHGIGLTAPQVAKRMRAELLLDRLVKQWEVSRWIRQVENWRIRTGLTIESVLEGPSKLDSGDLVVK